MFSTLWDTETVADADVWADFSDHAEDTWTDEADADEDELEGNEDAYLDEYYESRWEM